MKKNSIDTLKMSKGFSLVEFLVYMGIVSILLLVLTDIFSQIISTQLSSQSTASVAQDGRFIYSRFIYDINTATAVTTPANLGDSSPTLVFTKGGNTYSYSVSDGNLLLTDPTGPAQLNSIDSSISAFLVKRIGNSGGKHTFQLQFTITGKQLVKNAAKDTKTFQTTAGLR